MARRGYPSEFRRRIVDLVEGGRKLAEGPWVHRYIMRTRSRIRYTLTGSGMVTLLELVIPQSTGLRCSSIRAPRFP